MNEKKVRFCPCCKKEYSDYPAISRQDNKTEICPSCGVEEALADMYNAKLAKEATVIMNAEITYVVNKDSDDFRLFDKMYNSEREKDFAHFIKAHIFADDVSISNIMLFDSAPEVRFDGEN